MNAAPCPTNCGRHTEPGKLLCRTCWARVPQPLQQRVYSTWRKLSHTNREPLLTGRQAALRAYREARDAAITAAEA